jgi:hypothetical protein
MSILDRIPQQLRRHARSLDQLGIDDVAWTKEDARRVLDSIRGSNIAVLGGDVFKEHSDGLEPAYDNWHCDRVQGESLTDYATRSLEHAWSYVERYPPEPTHNEYFRLVLSDAPTAGW